MSNATNSQPIPLASIDPSRDNPRQDFDAAALDSLARSIARVGVLEPVIVRPIGERFELVAGERRYRACLQLAMETIPAIVRELSDLQAAEVRLLENLDRRELNPIEEAIGFRRLRDLGHTPETLAALVRRSQGEIENRVELLRLPQCWRDRVSAGTLAPLAAEYLTPFADRPEILVFMDGIFRDRWPLPLASWRKRLNDSILASSRPLDGENPNGPRFTPTAGELRSLDIVTIRHPSGRRESRAMNLELWDRLQRDAPSPPAPEAEPSQGTPTPPTPAARAVSSRRIHAPDGDDRPPTTTAVDDGDAPAFDALNECQARRLARELGIEVSGAADGPEVRAILRYALESGNES